MVHPSFTIAIASTIATSLAVTYSNSYVVSSPGLLETLTSSWLIISSNLLLQFLHRDSPPSYLELLKHLANCGLVATLLHIG